jgi:hypothetical protein
VCLSGQTSNVRVPTISWLEERNRSLGASQVLQTSVSCEIGATMLWTILVVLCVLWLLGVVTSYTLGGFIHVLLLVALAIFVINLIQGRRRIV